MIVMEKSRHFRFCQCTWSAINTRSSFWYACQSSWSLEPASVLQRPLPFWNWLRKLQNYRKKKRGKKNRFLYRSFNRWKHLKLEASSMFFCLSPGTLRLGLACCEGNGLENGEADSWRSSFDRWETIEKVLPSCYGCTILEFFSDLALRLGDDFDSMRSNSSPILTEGLISNRFLVAEWYK